MKSIEALTGEGVVLKEFELMPTVDELKVCAAYCIQNFIKEYGCSV